MLSIQSISLQAGIKPLLEKASFTLHPGQKVGLIGQNGAGKTTLFKAILNLAHYDAGSISMPNNWLVGYVEQEVETNNITALDYVTSGDTVYAKVNANIQQAELEEHHENMVKFYDDLDKISGYHIPQKAQQLLYGLGFVEEDFIKPIQSFSGGWQVRLKLARALMQRADLLLLDEPTNHLDIEAVAWLIQWLKQFEGAVVVISHDRHFLDEVVQGIAHIHQQKIHYYSGNFESFELQRNEQLMQQQSLHDKQKQQMQHLKSFIDRFKAKASKAKQAQSRVKALERMDKVAAVQASNPFLFQFANASHLPDPMLQMYNLTFGYDIEKPIIKQADFVLRAGDRIGLVGINGSGKSTLLKLLVGDIKPSSGRIQVSKGVSFGYFAQHQLESLVLEQSPIEHMLLLSPAISDKEARSFLGQFGFSSEKALDKVSLFSGGEKARLSLALIVYQKPNLIILDEPTNHLDMETRDALDIALQEFDGALILVTHDQHLLESIVDQYWWVHDGRVQKHNGDLESYLQQRLKQIKQLQYTVKQAVISSDTNENNANKKQQRQASAEQRKVLNKAIRVQTKQLKKVESVLQKSQERLQELHFKMEDSSLYEAEQLEQFKDILKEETSLKISIEEFEEEWLLLEVEIENILYNFKTPSKS